MILFMITSILHGAVIFDFEQNLLFLSFLQINYGGELFDFSRKIYKSLLLSSCNNGHPIKMGF